MDVNEIKNKVEEYIRFLGKLMDMEGLPVERQPDGALIVRGHKVSLMLCNALMTNRFRERFMDGDLSVVNEFLDNNWAKLQTPYKEPEKPKKKTLLEAWAEVEPMAILNG